MRNLLMLNRLLKTIFCLVTATVFVFSQDTSSHINSLDSLLKAYQTILSESIGKQAPALSFQDMKDSSSHDLLEFKGKVILLVFGGRGCQGCIAEMPDISYLQDEYEKVGLRVIFLGNDLDHFIKDYNISGINAHISGDVFNYSFLYRPIGVPTLILIDRIGIVKDAWQRPIGYNAMEKKINSLIPKETKSFKLRNPKRVLFSIIGIFGICLIVIAIVWNKKKPPNQAPR